MRIAFLFFCGTWFFAACNTADRKKPFVIKRATYYWKSVYKNNTSEQATLQQHHINTLYIKFFDVDWNYEQQKAFPLSKIIFADKPSQQLVIIPTVFITNRCMNQVKENELPELATKIVSLLQKTCEEISTNKIPEIQIDCDWSEQTKEKYFHLLELLKPQTFLSDKKISATIRLFQIKYKVKLGVPPVDKGLLMAYNMGDLKRPGSTNSILDNDVLEKYIGHLENYKLPMDVALPIFSWYVWFEANGSSYKGLVHDYDIPLINSLPVQEISTGKFQFTKATDTLGYHFNAGDVLRKETSDLQHILKAEQQIAQHLKTDTLQLSVFHLDSIILDKLNSDDLEKIYSGFHP